MKITRLIVRTAHSAIYPLLISQVFSICQIGWCADFLNHSDAMKGLSRVQVEILNVTQGDIDLGVHEYELRRVLQLRLRQNGLIVQDTLSPGCGVVSVSLLSILPKPSGSPGITSYVVEFALYRLAVLDLWDPKTAKYSFAKVWSNRQLATVGSAKYTDAVIETVTSLTDDFLNEFLAENPPAKR